MLLVLGIGQVVTHVVTRERVQIVGYDSLADFGFTYFVRGRRGVFHAADYELC